MYQLSEKSQSKLKGVHPLLVQTVNHAILLTEIDFGVTCGVRTLLEQKEMVDKGASWTLKSKHLIQTDGFSHAVDLIAYIAGNVSWGMKHYALIAEAMLRAGDEVGLELTWGAVWDKPLRQLQLYDGLDNDIDEYVARFKAKNGKRPRLDGPHFETRGLI